MSSKRGNTGLRVAAAVILFILAAAVLFAISTIEGLGTCNPNENDVRCGPEKPADLALYVGGLPVLVGCVLVAVGRPARWCIPGGVALAFVGVGVAIAVTA